MSDTSSKPVITRVAPSPTGLLHSGTYRTALFSYLYARKNGGKFFLRIEDTDRERSTKENEDNIIESLKWVGLDYDEVPATDGSDAKKFWRQSERTEVYKKYIEKLIADGHAYVSKEAPREVKEGEPEPTQPQRTEVIRFKNPNKLVTFHDAIRGDITFDTRELKDFVIAKSLTEPIFHLTVVVDDFEMGVTHVVRGEDHISNTPRHILIQEAIGASHPVYAHLPLILAPDKSKLSKRKGAQPLTYYRDKGYLPEAMVNYLALLGWNPGTDQELFTINELIKAFDFSGIQKGGAMFNQEKLDWFNREYIKKLPAKTIEDEIEKAVKKADPSIAELGYVRAKNLLPLVLDRIVTLNDIGALFAIDDTGEFDFAFKAPDYSRENLLIKSKVPPEKTKEFLIHILDLLTTVDASESTWTADGIKTAIFDYATEVGRGEVLWPFRYCLTGKDKSPDPFTVAALLGKTETLSRLKKAIALI